MQIAAGLHGSVHQIARSRKVLPAASGADAQSLVVKVAFATASSRDAIQREAQLYEKCQAEGLTGSEGVLPAFYGHGQLEDGRPYIVLQRLSGARICTLTADDVEPFMAGLQRSLERLWIYTRILHCDIRFDNAMYDRDSGKVRTVAWPTLLFIMERSFHGVYM